MNFSAALVRITSTWAPDCASLDARSAALYAAMEPVTPSVIRFPESTPALAPGASVGTNLAPPARAGVVLERLDISVDYTSREIDSHAIATYCPGAPEIREFDMPG